MHMKRCAVQPAFDEAGRPVVRRRVTQDLRRYLVLEGATILFGNLSREFQANVLITGIDIDDMVDVLDAGQIVMATMEISETDGDLPLYRLTNAVTDARPRRAAQTSTC